MKLFTLVAASTLLAVPAFAADAVVYSEPAPVVADTFSWTGGYVGVNAGYAGGKFKHPINVNAYGEDEVFNLFNGSLDVTASGFIGGVQAGYNWQMDRTVVGIETDIQASGLKGEFSANFNDVAGIEAGTKIKWFGTTRARLGYLPTERFMVYATGGIAYGKVETYGSIEFLGTGAGFSSSKTKVGYTVGAGAEYAINNNWTVKSEYLYTDLGKNKLTLSEDNIRADVEAKSAFHTVRVGLNYKF